MSVATSSIPHRKPSAGRAGCSGSLHRKLVEGREGNQRCKKERSNTGDTPCSHKADSLGGCWVVEAGGRGLQHVVPSARIARERSAGTKWRGVEPPGALKKRPALSGLAASVWTPRARSLRAPRHSLLASTVF